MDLLPSEARRLRRRGIPDTRDGEHHDGHNSADTACDMVAHVLDELHGAYGAPIVSDKFELASLNDAYGNRRAAATMQPPDLAARSGMKPQPTPPSHRLPARERRISPASPSKPSSPHTANPSGAPLIARKQPCSDQASLSDTLPLHALPPTATRTQTSPRLPVPHLPTVAPHPTSPSAPFSDQGTGSRLRAPATAQVNPSPLPVLAGAVPTPTPPPERTPVAPHHRTLLTARTGESWQSSLSLPPPPPDDSDGGSLPRPPSMLLGRPHTENGHHTSRSIGNGDGFEGDQGSVPPPPSPSASLQLSDTGGDAIGGRTGRDGFVGGEEDGESPPPAPPSDDDDEGYNVGGGASGADRYSMGAHVRGLSNSSSVPPPPPSSSRSLLSSSRKVHSVVHQEPTGSAAPPQHYSDLDDSLAGLGVVAVNEEYDTSRQTQVGGPGSTSNYVRSRDRSAHVPSVWLTQDQVDVLLADPLDRDDTIPVAVTYSRNDTGADTPDVVDGTSAASLFLARVSGAVKATIGTGSTRSSRLSERDDHVEHYANFAALIEALFDERNAVVTLNPLHAALVPDPHGMRTPKARSELDRRRPRPRPITTALTQADTALLDPHSLRVGTPRQKADALQRIALQTAQLNRKNAVMERAEWSRIARQREVVAEKARYVADMKERQRWRREEEHYQQLVAEAAALAAAAPPLPEPVPVPEVDQHGSLLSTAMWTAQPRTTVPVRAHVLGNVLHALRHPPPHSARVIAIKATGSSTTLSASRSHSVVGDTQYGAFESATHEVPSYASDTESRMHMQRGERVSAAHSETHVATTHEQASPGVARSGSTGVGGGGGASEVHVSHGAPTSRPRRSSLLFRAQQAAAIDRIDEEEQESPWDNLHHHGGSLPVTTTGSAGEGVHAFHYQTGPAPTSTRSAADNRRAADSSLPATSSLRSPARPKLVSTWRRDS